MGESREYGSGRGDPLFDTLFRSTAPPLLSSSAAPVRVTGTRSRAGNAMNRTRAALLEGARQAVEINGTKISMSQVAACAGVAKATLYNHFRTREAVLGALLEHEITALIDSSSGLSADAALERAAIGISEHPVLRALARVEPGTLAALARVDFLNAGWRSALDAVRSVLATGGLGGERIVLRWLASFMLTPADAHAITADLNILIAGLPVARATEQARSA